jgi:hypothetical protein
LFVAQGSDRPPYDDSYFFKRFALNFLDHGVFASKSWLRGRLVHAAGLRTLGRLRVGIVPVT